MEFDNQTSASVLGASTAAPIAQIEARLTRAAAPAAASSPVRPSSPRAIVDGSAAHPLDRVARLIERFVFLKKPCLYRLLALWSASTHIYSDFEYTGYIFVSSPEPQSGKTTLLELLDLLVANSDGIVVSPTEATLFRTADGQTQILDEVDGITNQEQLRNVLNAGFQKGATVRRMQESRDGEYQARRFPVYAPRILAGIGSRILSPATRDRTFGVEMVRQKSDERRERLRLSQVRTEAEAIKAEVAVWMKEHREPIIQCYYSFDFSYLQKLRDRTIDVAQPLAAILEVAYKDQPTLNAVRQELFDAVSITRNEENAVTDDHRILQVLMDLARSEDPLVGNATELAQKSSVALGQAPESIPITAVLRKYGFDTKSIRTDETDSPRYRYSLSLEALVDLLSQYGGVAEASASQGMSGTSA